MKQPKKKFGSICTLFRSLSYHDSNDNKYFKTLVGWTTNLLVHNILFLDISLPSLYDYDMKFPSFTFMEDIKKRRRASLSLSEFGTNFLREFILWIGDFYVLRELMFSIRTDWFFLLGINFCDFQKVPSV